MVWYDERMNKQRKTTVSDTNIVILSGRLTRQVERRETGSGTAVADIPLAVNRFRKGGEQSTIYPKVTVWDKQAEFAINHLGVGDTVTIQGELANDNYTDKDGVEHKGRLKVNNARVNLVAKRQASTEETQVTEAPSADEIA